MLVSKRIRLRLDDVYKDVFSGVPLYEFALMLLSAISQVVKLVHRDEKRYKYVYRNNRYINPRYYRRYKHLDIPKGQKWVLITLTLRRDIPLCTAWANIGSWISSFLHNMRTYFYRRKVKIFYFWVIEAHKDGYPHVHILVAFPFLSLEKIQSWWRWSDPQGVDVRFIGSDAQQVKNYVLRYLVKSQYVDFEVNYKEGYIEFGIVPFLLWFNRVRLLGRTRGFFLVRLRKEREWFYVGRADFVDDVLCDLRENLEALKINYDTQELKSLLTSFLTMSGITFEYKRSEAEPLDLEPIPYDLDF